MFDVDHRCRRGTGGGGALQRASARKHLPSSVRGLEARLEVSWFVVADGGSRSAWPGWRRWCAPCPLTCPRGLGWTAPRASVGSLSGLSLDACGLETTDAAVGLGPLRSSGLRRPGARRTPRRADWTPVCGVWMTAGLSRRSPPRRSRGSPSPAQPPRRFAWACGRGYPRLTGSVNRWLSFVAARVRTCDATVCVHALYDNRTPFVPGVEAPQLDREREYGSETRTTTGGRTAHQTGQQCIRGPGNP